MCVCNGLSWIENFKILWCASAVRHSLLYKHTQIKYWHTGPADTCQPHLWTYGFPPHTHTHTHAHKADGMSLKGLIFTCFMRQITNYTHPQISSSHTHTNTRGEVIDFRCFGLGARSRSAVGPLAWLLLSPWFQDDVPPVCGVMVRYKWNVECSQERRWPETK